jgi:hypothetical protein
MMTFKPLILICYLNRHRYCQHIFSSETGNRLQEHGAMTDQSYPTKAEKSSDCRLAFTGVLWPAIAAQRKSATQTLRFFHVGVY